ncbi:hypothetical protein DAPPUDRAFT_232278 [Daphnia pulex]|uniref:Uncharacterized protein n=1 Tax=Daphnia pulex TaxID=6669 RepID=E9FS93_DAPPU|nr:hypothetical protein DAPPUDRAFT_232278 [Daphnia pulex]|eukprot:EFX89998.1 hypothetical protein DAPPUDRAFT_232278 [Daphnia pulex]
MSVIPIPIPSNVNLQKEKGVCMAFTFGGHGDHYRLMFTTPPSHECYMVIYAALNYYTKASKCYTINVQPICKQGSVYYTTIDPDCYAAPNRYIEAPKYYTIEDYYDVVLLLGVVLWMAGFTMSVPMSPGYGGFQNTRLLPYYLTTSTYASPTYYTDACKYYTSKAPRVLHEYLRSSELLNGSITLLPSYINKTSEYYTEDLKYTSKVNCGVVLLLRMVSLKAGLIIGVLRYLDMAYYNTKAPVPEYYTTHTAPAY